MLLFNKGNWLLYNLMAVVKFMVTHNYYFLTDIQAALITLVDESFYIDNILCVTT